jgi:hypothetical protein
MSNIQVIQLAEYKQPIIKEDTREEWVEYGENNDFFDFLIERHKKSTTNNAIINTITRLIYGKGLTALDANKKPSEYAQLITLISSDDIRKNLGELKMLGQCAIQVHYNKKRDRVLKAFHVPVNLLRAEKCNKDGEITGYYYSDNWQDVKKFQPKRLDAFGFGSGEIEILYVKPYSVGMKYYSNVDYQGALPYCTLEEEISDYLINLTQRRFTPTLLLNFNNGFGTPEQQDEVHRSIKNKFTGSKGEPYILSFNKNKESAATIDSIQLDNAPEHYSFLSEECLRKIMLGHQVTSPLIFGIATSTGFSSNADELKNSLTIFDNLVIKPFQDLYLDAIEKILSFNGISLKLSFESLNPFEDRSAKVEDANTKETTLSSQEIDLSAYGEDIDENEWVLIDSHKVNYDLENELDLRIEELNNPKTSKLKQIVNFVKTGTANPNAKSEQDGQIFKTRYRYSGNVGDNSREFCKAMLSANKVYRKEDIIRMESQEVNKGWGPNGADNYSIWIYKGGGDCHHYWTRETYLRKSDANSPLAKKFTPSETRKQGEIAPTNESKVYQKPKDMEYNGFLPTNKRFN